MTTLPDRVRRRVTLASVGVGLVEAAVGTTRALAEHDVDAVILVGTAGVYPGRGNRVTPGQACLVREAVLLPHVLSGAAQAFLPTVMPHTIATTRALTRHLSRATPGLPTVDVACPLAITASAAAARAAAKRSDCILENLEAFAVARAARIARIPFAAVLGVANHVGPQGHREWTVNGKQAAENACRVVFEALRA
jgi:nucleoside phosphorylase